MRMYIILAALLILTGVASYIIIGGEMISIDSIYLLPYIWGVLLLVCLQVWKFNLAKLLVILHVAVGCTIAFGILLYRLYLKLEPTRALKEGERFYRIGNLMFNSENALYPGIYLAFLLALADLLLWRRWRKKRKHTP